MLQTDIATIRALERTSSQPLPDVVQDPSTASVYVSLADQAVRKVNKSMLTRSISSSPRRSSVTDEVTTNTHQTRARTRARNATPERELDGGESGRSGHAKAKAGLTDGSSHSQDSRNTGIYTASFARDQSPLFGLEQDDGTRGELWQSGTLLSDMIPDIMVSPVYVTSDAGPSFDLARYMTEPYSTASDSWSEVTKAPDDLYPFASAGPSVSPLPVVGPDASPSLLQHRASAFDSTLESPLEVPLDSPAGSSDYHHSPFDAGALVSPSAQDYSPLFASPKRRGLDGTPVDDSLYDLFPDLRLSNPSSTVFEHSGADGVAQPTPAVPAGPSSRLKFNVSSLPALPFSSSSSSAALVGDSGHVPEDTKPEIPLDEEDSREDSDQAELELDLKDEHYVPERSIATESASTRKTRKRKHQDTGLQDKDTDKRVYHGPRTYAAAPTVPIDAPIQPRKWKGESRTSRKLLPKAIVKTISSQRWRASSVSEGSPESGEIDEETKVMIDTRRAQNTIAARKSRERKAAYLAGLEDAVERLSEENEQLKERLRAAGLE